MNIIVENIQWVHLDVNRMNLREDELKNGVN